MNELADFMSQTSEQITQIAELTTRLTSCIDVLTKKVISLEEDVKNILENTGSIKRG